MTPDELFGGDLILFSSLLRSIPFYLFIFCGLFCENVLQQEVDALDCHGQIWIICLERSELHGFCFHIMTENQSWNLILEWMSYKSVFKSSSNNIKCSRNASWISSTSVCLWNVFFTTFQGLLKGSVLFLPRSRLFLLQGFSIVWSFHKCCL